MPVVPPVYCSRATSSGFTSGHCAGGEAPATNALAAMTPGRSGAASWGIGEAPHAASSPTITWSTRPASSILQRIGQEMPEIGVRRMRAPLSLSLCVNSRSASSGLRWTIFAPAFSAAEEGDGMQAAYWADKCATASLRLDAGAQERGGHGVGRAAKFGEGDPPIAKFDGGAFGEFADRLREQRGDRADADRRVPGEPRRILTFPRKGRAPRSPPSRLALTSSSRLKYTRQTRIAAIVSSSYSPGLATAVRSLGSR